MNIFHLISFLVLEVLLFLFHNFLLNGFEPFKGEYLLSFLATIPAIIAVGYILFNYLLEPKRSQDKALESIIKETLHEINLPISTIEANSKMLSKSLDSSRDLKRVYRIEGSLIRLKRLYEQLRYNIKKDILPIDKELVDLKDLVNCRVEYFRELNRNSFRLNLDSLIVKIDKIGFEQALDNVIENSMKYSKKDSEIVISIDKYRVIVEDYGVGIAEDELSLIYQIYYRNTQDGSGEGIGLSIVKEYCDKSNILVKIESKKWVGTKVIFDFKSIVR